MNAKERRAAQKAEYKTLSEEERDARANAREKIRLEEERASEDRENEKKKVTSKRMEEAEEMLTRRGYKVEHTSESGSKYLKRDNTTIRLSDHELPPTPERTERQKKMGVTFKNTIIVTWKNRPKTTQEIADEIQTIDDFDEIGF